MVLCWAFLPWWSAPFAAGVRPKGAPGSERRRPACNAGRPLPNPMVFLSFGGCGCCLVAAFARAGRGTLAGRIGVWFSRLIGRSRGTRLGRGACLPGQHIAAKAQAALTSEIAGKDGVPALGVPERGDVGVALAGTVAQGDVERDVAGFRSEQLREAACRSS